MAELGPFATRYAASAMVCSVDHVASGAGLSMLRRGGTAADAAVATSAVLAVTTPHMCGMGGDLFALVHDRRGPPAALNASGRSGSGVDAAALRAEGLTRMPFRDDIRSVPVPGCVDGWAALHDRFGSLPLGEVLAPAQELAEEGFCVSALLSAMAPFVEAATGARDLFEGGRPRPGDRRRRPGVAQALRAIASSGRDGFYLGAFGEGLLRLGGGVFAPSDLERSQADWVEPISVEAWGRRVWTVPPNSQGYLTLSATWMAERLALPEEPGDPRWAHLLVEAAKQSAADRLAVLHDDASGPALLDPARLEPRLARIDRERATRVAPPASAGDTIFLCAVDSDGMGVSLIQSNATGFGSHLFEPNTGTYLHNRGIGFSVEADHPAELRPGRRPPSTLSPALVTDGGRLDAVIGTMGGDSQPQILLQLLTRLYAAGEPPGAALAAGRWVLTRRGSIAGFDTWTEPASIGVDVEGQADERWVPGLSARGHDVERRGAFDHGAGHAHVIRVLRSGLGGASDPRAGSGAAIGC